MEFKDEGSITITKGAKKKIKCHKVFCKPLNREIMIHEDIDNKRSTTVSDCITGYRMFNIPIELHFVDKTHVRDGFKKFVNHYTLEGIQEEFKRIESIMKNNESGKRNK